MTKIDEKNYLHDFIIHEDDERYSRDTVTFNNDTGATASFAPGVCVIVTAGVAVPAGAAEVATGILVTQVNDLPDAGNAKVAVLARAALVNGDRLNYNGDSAATKQAELLAVGIKSMDEPVKVERLPA